MFDLPQQLPHKQSRLLEWQTKGKDQVHDGCEKEFKDFRIQDVRLKSSSSSGVRNYLPI